MRLLLVNPNTSRETTDSMVRIAEAAAPEGVVIEGATAPWGVGLITNEAQLTTASEAVLDLLRGRATLPDGVIIAAFGDPALEEARTLLSCPVTGIAEAGMAEAAAGGRPFAVATTTPDLAAAIAATAHRYGHASLFRGVHLTPGDPAVLMADPERLQEALADACRAAIAAGAEAVVIGGGPLAVAARAIAPLLPVPVIEPVPAAMRLALERASSGHAAP